MKRTISYGLLFALLLVGCGGEEETDESMSDVQDVNVDEGEQETDGDTEVLEESLDEDVSLPTALQVAQIFNGSGMAYIDGLTNSGENIDQYTTYLSKALNFGIYSADLAYCIINERYEDASNYMGQVRALGLETGLDVVFNSEDLMRRFEENQANKDSIIPILMDINFRTEDIFDQDPEAELKSAVHFTGAWIEGLYLGSQVLSESWDDDLGMTLEELMDMIKPMIIKLKMQREMPAELEELIAGLEDLKEVYFSFESVKKLIEAEDIQSSPELTEEEIKTLVAKLEVLRNSIVNG